MARHTLSRCMTQNEGWRRIRDCDQAQTCLAKNFSRVQLMNGCMSKIILALLLFACWLAPAPAHAQPANAAAVEKQFQSWLKSDIWPMASAKGVTAGTFSSALQGVKLNWKLPDLAPPGTKPQGPQK